MTISPKSLIAASGMAIMMASTSGFSAQAEMASMAPDERAGLIDFVIEHSDADGDGSVTLAEFKALEKVQFSNVTTSRQPQPATAVGATAPIRFERLDVNDDGVVNRLDAAIVRATDG